ncbi:hypothetical protein FSPOR_11473 [Fusarium sporotrichioides]|uniref:Uncharacterized protein n=1 Tax=Fusarium sporotrichioides TaxID=5514 RepID=A0A395RGN7_FUSSP|nr:hypothetical protein FSPOR_11473 [Fusarium sporotrichioides]
MSSQKRTSTLLDWETRSSPPPKRKRFDISGATRVNRKSLQAVETAIEANISSIASLDAAITSQEERLDIENANLIVSDQLRQKLRDATLEYEAAEDVSERRFRRIQSLPKVTHGRHDKHRHIREVLRKVLIKENETVNEKGLAVRCVWAQWTNEGGAWIEAEVNQCKAQLEELQQQRVEAVGAGEELKRKKEMLRQAIDFLSLIEGDPSRAVMIMDID